MMIFRRGLRCRKNIGVQTRMIIRAEKPSMMTAASPPENISMILSLFL